MIEQIEIRNLGDTKDFKKQLNNSVVIFYGKEETDKKSILESIYLTAFKRSFFTQDETKVINKNNRNLSTTINIKLEEQEEEIKLLINDGKTIEQSLNDTRVETNRILALFHPIMISGNRIEDFKFNQSTRLFYLDQMISMESKIYPLIMSQFNEKKKLLIKAKKSNYGHEFINSTVEELAKLESEIIQHRENFAYEFKQIYLTNCKKVLKKNFILEYKSIKKNENEDIKKYLFSSDTLTVNNDDWVIREGTKNFLRYASMEEIKITLIVLLISFIEYLNKIFRQEFPLLVDELLSELDEKNINVILEMLLEKNINALITSTSLDKIKKETLERIQTIKI